MSESQRTLQAHEHYGECPAESLIASDIIKFDYFAAVVDSLTFYQMGSETRVRIECHELFKKENTHLYIFPCDRVFQTYRIHP